VEIERGAALPSRAYFLDGGAEVEFVDGGRNKHNNRLLRFVIPDNFDSGGKPFVVVLEFDRPTDTTDESYQQART